MLADALLQVVVVVVIVVVVVMVLVVLGRRLDRRLCHRPVDGGTKAVRGRLIHVHVHVMVAIVAVVRH